LAYKPITDQQVRLYMTDLQNHSQRSSAARAGFSERTARRFDTDPTPPSKRKIMHGRTVTDPLEGYWENDLLPVLGKDSALQAVPGRWPSATESRLLRAAFGSPAMHENEI
jgi:hypothetical protein